MAVGWGRDQSISVYAIQRAFSTGPRQWLDAQALIAGAWKPAAAAVQLGAPSPEHAAFVQKQSPILSGACAKRNTTSPAATSP